MADETDCHKFYRCVDNGKGGYTRHDFVCGQGTAWDDSINTCNFENEVARCANQTSPPATTTEQSTTTDGQTQTESTTSQPGQETTTTMSTTTESTGETTTEMPPRYPTNCDNQTNAIICKEEGYYPHPDDCSQFYRCMDHDGQKKRYSLYHYDCPNGTIWDTNQNKCNDAHRIDPPRTECQTQTTTTTEAPATTTTVQDTTTQATTQDTTTQGQESTTQAAETTTTQAAETTTQPPETTTQPPETTTTADTTTQAQETTTTEQATTTVQTTTQGAETTTTTQETTTQESTTTEQATTTQETTTQAQDSTTTDQTTTTTSDTTTQQTTTQGQDTTTTTGASDTTTQQTTTQGSDTTTTEQMQTTTEGTETTTHQPGDASCPPMNANQNAFVCPTGFRRYPGNCTMFYQCTQESNSFNMHIVAFSCPVDTVYNEDQRQCLPPSQAPPCSNSNSSSRMLRGVSDPRSAVS